MAVVDTTTLRTPEGVGYSLALAGLGSRFAAGLIDAILQLILILVMFALTSNPFDDSGGVATAILGIATFVIFFGYQFLCESFLRGRTLGKRLTGLRVVNLQGGPVSVRQSAVRNIVRIVDILPTAVHLDEDVTAFAAMRMLAFDDDVVNDDAAADPGAERPHEQARLFVRGAEPKFTVSRGVGVVL